jgi:anti-anti-sigma factor
MISIDHFPPAARIRIEGRFDAIRSAEFDQAVAPLLESHRHIVIDFGQCRYMSSGGIRSLMVAMKKLNSRGGKLFLTRLPVEVLQILEMAGLQNVFRIVDTNEQAHAEILKLEQSPCSSRDLSVGNCRVHFQRLENSREPALLWTSDGIAGYDELGFSIGIGAPTDAMDYAATPQGLFVTTGHCAGFVFFDQNLPADFRVTREPKQAGIYLSRALTLGFRPDACARLESPDATSIAAVADILLELTGQVGVRPKVMGAVMAATGPKTPSLSVFLISDPSKQHKPEDRRKDEDYELGFSDGLPGITFELEALPEIGASTRLDQYLEKALSLDNICNVTACDAETRLAGIVAWLFLADETRDAASGRIQVESDEDLSASPHKAFLARRLYGDSRRLELKTLQGGYTAHTYQVNSYDLEGRKLHPTVLKIGSHALIARESERCRQYAMPYIFNNSAMVLGTEYFGDVGAIRYNFVGIGGEQSRLKWLRHYFETWPVEKLQPLFDKIFLQILNPWYGQSAVRTIHPFLDHDPTRTFFPHIFAEAEKCFGISSDDSQISVEETGQKLLNPYRILKHEYPRRYEMSMDYRAAICHGDLNMQNILLDEEMNVYLIDFSETRPRSAVSDFARLEAIFIIEFTPLDTADEFHEMLRLLGRLYDGGPLGHVPDAMEFENPAMRRSLAMTHKMRQYAMKFMNGDPNPIPYYIALLEWVLPVVCYYGQPTARKRLSMVASAILCEKVMAAIQAAG